MKEPTGPLDPRPSSEMTMMLQKIVLTPALTLGIKDMDDEHQELVKLINVLVDMVNARASCDEMQGTYDALIGWVDKHFRNEEAFQGSIGFPGLKAHKVAHRKLEERAVQYQKEMQMGTLDGVSLINFLQAWLRNHITKMDTRYALHAKNKITKRESRARMF